MDCEQKRCCDGIDNLAATTGKPIHIRRIEIIGRSRGLARPPDRPVVDHNGLCEDDAASAMAAVPLVGLPSGACRSARTTASEVAVAALGIAAVQLDATQSALAITNAQAANLVCAPQSRGKALIPTCFSISGNEIIIAERYRRAFHIDLWVTPADLLRDVLRLLWRLCRANAGCRQRKAPHGTHAGAEAQGLFKSTLCGASSRTSGGARIQAVERVGTAARFVDAADLPLSGKDRVIRPVLVDPGAEAGRAQSCLSCLWPRDNDHP